MRNPDTQKRICLQRGFEECFFLLNVQIIHGPPMDKEGEGSYSSDKESMIERQEHVLDFQMQKQKFLTPHVHLSAPCRYQHKI